ncbi:hypothetical protein J1605_016933 [Eschrichtius robustus]|uniref:Uncharacterized protein n=1 Tax=Eschrichtius robustus TaxID=9764 RepID=A0AB34I537_ESCRO|nr:hypothetical protein J1605_016933 [Eschrichtius robustus]
MRPCGPGPAPPAPPAAGLSRCHVRPQRRGAGPGARPAGGAERAERSCRLPSSAARGALQPPRRRPPPPLLPPSRVLSLLSAPPFSDRSACDFCLRQVRLGRCRLSELPNIFTKPAWGAQAQLQEDFMGRAATLWPNSKPTMEQRKPRLRKRVPSSQSWQPSHLLSLHPLPCEYPAPRLVDRTCGPLPWLHMFVHHSCASIELAVSADWLLNTEDFKDPEDLEEGGATRCKEPGAPSWSRAIPITDHDELPHE